MPTKDSTVSNITLLVQCEHKVDLYYSNPILSAYILMVCFASETPLV